MPVLLVRDALYHRLEVCSGVRETNEPGFRPGSLVPRGDWKLVEETEQATAWDRYENGGLLHENVALVRVVGADLLLDAEGSHLAPSAPSTGGVSRPGGQVWHIALEQLDAICRRLCPDEALEHKGCWLAKGGGTSLSTTIDRRDRKLIGLHVDWWERRSLMSVSLARNRVCLNMGPRPRWFVFAAIDLLETAARCGIDPTISFTTSHAQAYLLQHPMTPIYRLRIEPGEAYVAPTERLIHDGQASTGETGEWVSTVFGRFERTVEARQLSVV